MRSSNYCTFKVIRWSNCCVARDHNNTQSVNKEKDITQELDEILNDQSPFVQHEVFMSLESNKARVMAQKLSGNTVSRFDTPSLPIEID